MKINILSSDVINMIAAGEVVQRPASAVKELIENAIDAEASRVDISFEAGGKTMRVSDNGNGMSGSEVEVAVRRHATSKIKSAVDLEKIKTLGFRGEALPSIGAVSRMSITTKAENSQPVMFKLGGGSRPELQPAARGRGTTVEVKDLFYNTPARRKFLKSDATEKKHIIETVEAAALASPEVSFALNEKERLLFDFPPADVKNRFCEVAGKNLSEKLAEVSFENPYVRLSGYVSFPSLSFSNRGRIYVFVNGRSVYSPLVLHAISRACRQFIPQGKYPACVLYINTKPEFVDVNVHPAKREVKFVNQQGVHQIVSKVLKSALEKTPGIFDIQQDDLMPDRYSGAEKDKRRPVRSFASRPGSKPERTSLEKLKDIDLSEVRKFSFSPPSLSDSGRAPSGEGSIRPAFQFKNKYIVAEDDEGILFIDQHTAWERINYENLKKEAVADKPAVQGLLIPEVIELERSKAHIVANYTGLLREYGLIIEEFGPSAFKVTAVPACVGKTISGEEAAEMIEEIIETVEKAGKSPSRDELADEIFKLIACRSSVMAGDSLTNEEIKEMTDKLNSCQVPHRCPHGRPVIIRFTEKEIDTRFSR